MWFSILFGLFLIAVAAMMLVRNSRIWRSVQTADMEEREHDFLYRQYRRRTQANWMIMIVGLAIVLGIWVTDSIIGAAYWMGVVLVVCWMTLLAFADLVSTRMHYGRVQQDQMEERASLEAELDQIRRRGSNGRSKTKPLEDLE